MADFHVQQSEDAIYTVYKITGPTGKVYIGCTKTTPKRRWRNGKGYKSGQPYFYADIEKFGWDAFKKEIVCEKLLKEGAENLEKFLVDFYDTCDPEKGYNTFTGGPRTGAVYSAAGRKRNSISVKAAYANNPEYRARIIAHHRQEYIAHPETLEKSRISHKRMWTPEFRQKQSERMKKYYETHCPDTKAKAVVCIETGEVYRSMIAAEQATGADHAAIGRVCRKLLYSAGGLHWEFWNGEKQAEETA